MPKKLFAGLAAAALIALMAASAQAAEKAAEDKAAADAAKLGLPVVSYYPLAPEIVTNYTASPRHIGHGRIRASIVLADTADVDAVKKYDPVIRDTLISILNESTAEDFENKRDELFKKMSDKTAAAVNDYAKRSLVKDFIVDNLIYQESR